MADGEVKALIFDVFGTVVDWFGSIVREGEELNRAKGWEVNWQQFATLWRGRYIPSMQRVARGELSWTKLDDLHRASLDELLLQFGLTDLSEAEKDHLNRVWHRLLPWPDAVEGLLRLKQRYIIATMSNGNVSLLVDMAKHAGLPWDCIFSAELARAYKPDPRSYLSAVNFLSLTPNEVMMVAAHADDLAAAKAQGLKTAFVFRPLEYGPHPTQLPVIPDAEAGLDYLSTDFADLAHQLGL